MSNVMLTTHQIGRYGKHDPLTPPVIVTVHAERLQDVTCAKDHGSTTSLRCQDKAGTDSRLTAVSDGPNASYPHQLGVDEDSKDDGGGTLCCGWLERFIPGICHPHGTQWFVFIAFWGSIVSLVVFFSIWALPRIVDNIVEPALATIKAELSPAQIGVIVILAIIIPPIVLLPGTPAVWLAALVFNFGIAVLLVTIGTTIGMAVVFLIGRKFLRKPLSRWLARYKPAKAVLVAIDRAGPFKITVLVRLGPIPYQAQNYLLSVPPSVNFGPYMAGSFLGKIPGNLLTVYFGRNIKGFSDLVQGKPMPATQIAFNMVGLTVSVILVVGGFIYARRALRQINAEVAAEEAAKAERQALAAAQEGQGPQPANEDIGSGDKQSQGEHVMGRWLLGPLPVTTLALSARNSEQATDEAMSALGPGLAAADENGQGSSMPAIVLAHGSAAAGPDSPGCSKRSNTDAGGGSISGRFIQCQEADASNASSCTAGSTLTANGDHSSGVSGVRSASASSSSASLRYANEQQLGEPVLGMYPSVKTAAAGVAALHAPEVLHPIGHAADASCMEASDGISRTPSAWAVPGGIISTSASTVGAASPFAGQSPMAGASSSWPSSTGLADLDASHTAEAYLDVCQPPAEKAFETNTGIPAAVARSSI